MTEKKDYSYGVIPVFKDETNRYKVLLVHQISYRGANESFWILPKGHAESGESPTATALRELEEETGVTDVTLLDVPQFSIKYSFVHEDEKIHKTVIYYLGFCKTMQIKLSQPEEIKALKWCDWKEAVNLVTHKNSKKVLTQAKKYLEGLQQH